MFEYIGSFVLYSTVYTNKHILAGYFPIVVTAQVFPEGAHNLTLTAMDCSGFSANRTLEYSILLNQPICKLLQVRPTFLLTVTC